MRYSLGAICLLLAASAPARSQPVRIQLVTGGHSHEISFYQVFQGHQDLKIDVNPHPGAFHSDLRKSVDVLVLYDMADMDGEAERGHLREFVEAGKGLVVLHHAIIDNQHWQWWYEEVTGGRYLLTPDGALKASTYQHDVPMRVRAAGKHPITDGLTEFAITDEAHENANYRKLVHNAILWAAGRL